MQKTWSWTLVAMALCTAEVRAAEPTEAEEKRGRRERAAALAGPDAVVLVLAADGSRGIFPVPRNHDFTYLSPLEAPGAAVLVAMEKPATAGAPPRTMQRLYLRPRNPVAEAWSGATAGPGDEAAAAALFDEAPPSPRLAEDLALLLGERTTLYVSPGGVEDSGEALATLLASVREKLPGHWGRLLEGPGAGRDDVAESLRLALPQRLPRERELPEVLAARPTVDVRLATPIVGQLREVKSPREIAAIRAAVDATVQGIHDALRTAAPGMAERELQAHVEFRCRLEGCATQAFPSIVASGPNSCVLHYMRNDRTLARGDLVVLDVGGEYDGYAADVTRTFPASGRFTDEQAKIYDAVLAAQEAALAEVRPGATLRKVHEAAVAVLKERGLVRYFTHGTSHSVGLYVHDSWRRDAELRPGCVITVEPGVYIADKSLGVRIEDTVLVTKTGCEVLSAKAPKTRAAIEAAMARK